MNLKDGKTTGIDEISSGKERSKNQKGVSQYLFKYIRSRIYNNVKGRNRSDKKQLVVNPYQAC